MDQGELRSEFELCRGCSTQDIAARFEKVELDVVTYELFQMCAERADPDLFRTYPAVTRHTMYGDDGVSDWITRYSPDGNTIESADDAVEVQGHVRWERWEDLLRLLHGEVTWMSLFYSLRAIALGEDVFRSHGRYWFMGINFTNDPDPHTPGRLMGLMFRDVWDPPKLAALIDEVGLDRLIAARAQTQAATWSDLGAGLRLAGSWVRWEIEGHPTLAEVTFDEQGGWSWRLLDRDEAASDTAGGITIWFATDQAFLYVASLREDISGQLVSGTARLVGSDDRLAAFSAATRRMYAPGGSR